jgi:hypothetical protein
MEAAWKASGGDPSVGNTLISAAGIKLESALAEIEESDFDSDDYLYGSQTHVWVWPIILWLVYLGRPREGPEMIAMQWIPFMAEITMRGLWGQLCTTAVVRTMYLLLCTGELCAFAWGCRVYLGGSFSWLQVM